MKKFSVFLAAVLVAMLMIQTTAMARDFSAREEGIGRLFCTPLKAFGEAVQALGETLTWQKPGAIIGAPNKLRKNAFDAPETLTYIISGTEAIPCEDYGKANGFITDIGADWLVDSVFYAAIIGPSVHNSVEVGTGHHHWLGWKAAFWSFVGAAGADVIDSQVNDQ